LKQWSTNKTVPPEKLKQSETVGSESLDGIPFHKVSPFTRISEGPFVKDFGESQIGFLEKKWLQCLTVLPEQPLDPWNGS
jgi:hypothetical protein